MNISKEAAARIINQIMGGMVNQFNDLENCPPMVALVTMTDGAVARIGVIEESGQFFQAAEDAKDRLSHFVQGVLRQPNGPDGVLVCNEAWISILPPDTTTLVGQPAPSLDPNRREALSCSLFTRDGGTYSHMLLVDPKTKQVNFEPYGQTLTHLWSRFTPGSASSPFMPDADDEEVQPAPTLH